MSPQESMTGTVQAETQQAYINDLVHSWSLVLAKLALTLVPIFFILDYFIMPRELLERFALYRLISVGLVFAQYLVIRNTRSSNRSVLHGYFITLVVGGVVALMTTDLGGFNSTYYAGLNLVLFAVTVLLPWEVFHSTLNSLFIIFLYVVLNLALPSEEAVNRSLLINNLYFLSGTAVIAVSISYVKQLLVRKEFSARMNLQSARDALWGEMEVAKRIQTSLLPKVHRIEGYSVAATMLPAEEVGGDYYDIIETDAGETWLSIGDVSGHGVESGLIMMMTQTSIFTTVNQKTGQSPSRVLSLVNSVIKENISRLGADRYMTISAIALGADRVIVAGKHQDVLVYRQETGEVEQISTTGTWLGVVDDIEGFLEDTTVKVSEGDILLFYTDGVTEAADAAGTMFGEDRLVGAFKKYARLEVGEIIRNIVQDVKEHMQQQDDDITLLVIRRVTPSGPRDRGRS